MNHELRSTPFKPFRDEEIFYCTCGSFFRMPINGTTVSDIEQMFATHKWAWQEEEKEEIDSTHSSDGARNLQPRNQSRRNGALLPRAGRCPWNEGGVGL
jgi:hypothetical protein